MKLTNSIIAAGVFLFFGTSLAYADNCTGLNVQVTRTAETTDMGNGHSITTWSGHSQTVSTDYPLKNGTTGVCSGAVLAMPDGKTQAMGYCLRRDKDGDTVTESWHRALGASKGKWRSVAGTGKFADWEASGWYQRAWSDGVMIADAWGGTCK